MAVKRIIPYAHGIYFITFTCHKWLNLIEFTNGYHLIYQWFDYLKQHGHFIVGYQLMPNHIHVVIAFRNAASINSIIGNGKRFIAYGIVKHLKELKETDLLEQLEKGVNNSDKKRGKLHEVWEDSFDWKECFNWKMIVQKLDYMHKNPCKGKWALVENPADYIHSSAGFYITGVQGVYPVTNYMQLNEIDLSKDEPPSPARDQKN